MEIQEEIVNSIKESIIRKYGSIKEFADSIGVTDSTVHLSLKTLSRKFIIKLENAGIEIPQTINKGHNIIGIMNDNAKNETHYHDGKESELIKENEYLRRENDLLKREIELLKKEIEFAKR